MDMKVHHIGYLVKNIEKAKKQFQNIGYQIEQDTVCDTWRDIDICFLVKDGYRIELVAPRTNTSAVGELRKKLNNSPYHICYEVDSLECAIEALREERYVIWQEPHEAPAIAGRKVAFLIHGQIGMIELVESAIN